MTDILEILVNGRIDWSDEHQTTTTIVTKNERLAIAEIKKLRARIAELEAVLDKSDAALSWMLLEGCDEAIPETCPTEYQSCVDALQSVRAALKGEKS